MCQNTRPAGDYAIPVHQLTLTLLEAHGRHLHALLYRLTLRHDAAEELMQELALKLLGSAGFAKAEQPYAFARTVALNLGFEWRRRRTRKCETEISPMLVEPASDAHLPLTDMMHTERVQHVLNELAQLDEPDRLVLAMRFLESRRYDDIGRELNRDAHHVRAMCSRAIVKLRDRLRLHDGSPVTSQEHRHGS